MTDFDAETAMTVGGWDHRYSRVLDVQVQGDVAAALVDANGDGADLNVDVYMRQPDGAWVEVASGNVQSAFPDGGLLIPPTTDSSCLGQQSTT